MNIQNDKEFIALKQRLGKIADINCIETEEELNKFIAQQQEEVEKVVEVWPESKRFYRGQYCAAWECSSTLLRKFKDLHPQCSESDIQREFYGFYGKNRHLWKLLFAPKFDVLKIAELFKEESKSASNELYSKFQESIKEAYEELCTEVNATWREIAAQHYGFPTGLLDFTKDVYVALYFATKKLSNNNSYKGGLNEYCSILHFDTKNEIVNWENSRSSLIDVLGPAFTYCDNNDIPLDVDYSAAVRSMNTEDDSSELDGISTPVYFDETDVRHISNSRINKQKGVLLCLGKNGYRSLEDSFAENTEKNPCFPKISMTIINRRLKEYVDQLLQNQEISDDTMGFKKYSVGANSK